VQTTCLFQDTDPGPEVQVVCIAEDDIGVNVFPEFPLVDALYRCGRANRHKNGGFNTPVIS
jgi:hypothetical protein